MGGSKVERAGDIREKHAARALKAQGRQAGHSVVGAALGGWGLEVANLATVCHGTTVCRWSGQKHG